MTNHMITTSIRFLSIALMVTLGLEATASKPNILFVFTDDHAAHAISSYGSEINTTPNIDRIAKEGMKFERCYVTNSICGPSRATILTGKYNHLNGFVRNGNTFNGEQQTFPKLLGKIGYQTAVIGKWHLKSTPIGFDHYDVLIGQGPYYNPPMKSRGDNGKPITTKHVGYTTDIVTDKALDYLKSTRDKSKPFMLMMQHKAPHRNWQTGPDHLTMYDGIEIPEPESLRDDYSGKASPARTQKMTITSHLSAKDLKLNGAPKNLNESQKELWNNAYAPKNKAFEEAQLTGDELLKWKYQRYIKDY